MPTISVILPCFNAEKYLAEAIESILNQSFSKFEFLILDDGSTDDTLKIINLYAAEDSRIRVLRNSDNKGLIFSLNKLIDQAKGNYIARMDADDISKPKRLEVLLNELETKDIDIVSSNFSYIDTSGEYIKDNIYIPEKSQEIFFASFLFNPICQYYWIYF